MLKKTASVLKYIIPIGIAFVLLYFAFKNVDFAEFWAKAKLVNYWWVLGSIALSYFSYVLRAYRWNLLLKPLGYPHLKIHRTTVAVLIGYLANLAFPRLGEVTRCGILKRNENVPMANSFGSVITERIIDVITLLLLILFTLLIEYDTLIAFFSNAFSGIVNIEGLAWKGALVLIGAFILVAILVYIAIRSGGRFRVIARQLLDGIFSLRKLNNVTGFLLSTLLLWVVYYFMSYIIVFAVSETSDLSWQAGVMLLVTSGVALAIPVQGGFGTYHTMVSGMLLLYNIDMTTGVFFATLLHTSQIIAIAVFGGVAVLVSLFMKKYS
ncbi:MAG: lysylphosphatidylglycerol synthase transmembrane domain-containing protein [Cyclobacteriaceae bacterium]